jgi:hypothetical protein
MKSQIPELLELAVICAIGAAIPLALCAAGAGYLLVCFGAGQNGTTGAFTSRDWVRFVGGGACVGAFTGLILGALVALIVGMLHNAVRRRRERRT